MRIFMLVILCSTVINIECSQENLHSLTRDAQNRGQLSAMLTEVVCNECRHLKRIKKETDVERLANDTYRDTNQDRSDEIEARYAKRCSKRNRTIAMFAALAELVKIQTEMQIEQQKQTLLLQAILRAQQPAASAGGSVQSIEGD